MRIDPTKTWRMVEARLTRERSPRLRRNLETVLAHMKAEAAPDLDALMATIADDARYHAWGTADPLYSPEGKEAVRRFYTVFVSSGAHRDNLSQTAKAPWSVPGGRIANAARLVPVSAATCRAALRACGGRRRRDPCRSTSSTSTASSATRRVDGPPTRSTRRRRSRGLGSRARAAPIPSGRSRRRGGRSTRDPGRARARPTGRRS